METQSIVGKDPLSLLMVEAEAYSRFEQIEKLVEEGGDLSCLPLQPLYMALKNLPAEEVGLYLPKLSSEQRQLLIDLDFWYKDHLDINSFNFWLEAYAACPDEEVQLEFVKNDDFQLFLKGKFHISTFDVEDPQYPDHDDYFLTDDQLLLVEYEKDFPYVQEIQNLIRLLYSHWGVEKAYAHLFKTVSDLFSQLEEEQYQQKTSRLRDFGFVDYYASLEIHSAFHKMSALHSFIKNKKPATGTIDQISRNQTLHSSVLRTYDKNFDAIKEEIAKIKDKKRSDYLQFNFIRLINSSLSFHDAMKSGSVAITQVGQKTRSFIVLGLSYLLNHSSFDHLKQLEEGVFQLFDFTDVYKIGLSLVEITKKEIKKSLEQNTFDDEATEYFLGSFWNKYLLDTYLDYPKFLIPGEDKSVEVESYPTYLMWSRQKDLLVGILAFIKKFFDAFTMLKNEGKISDHFYVNYSAETIDFEAILLSSFINFSLGVYDDPQNKKMGITVPELKKFLRDYGQIEPVTKIKPLSDQYLFDKIVTFKTQFGFSDLVGFEDYFHQILNDQLAGYELENLSDEEFKHVGGPILLKV